jgi:hypothetical protein
LAQLLADIPGRPTHDQVARIETIVRLEWKARVAEEEGTLQGDREAREHLRLADRLRADHQRSLAKAVKEKPEPVSLVQHLELIRQGPG